MAEDPDAKMWGSEPAGWAGHTASTCCLWASDPFLTYLVSTPILSIFGVGLFLAATTWPSASKSMNQSICLPFEMLGPRALWPPHLAALFIPILEHSRYVCKNKLLPTHAIQQSLFSRNTHDIQRAHHGDTGTPRGLTM